MNWSKIYQGKFIWLWLLGIALTACSSGTANEADTDGLQVVATTTLIGDTVRVVAGDQVELFVLLPAGGDPHGFNPTPQDIAKIAAADAVFINGLELEAFLEDVVANANHEMNIIDLSEQVETVAFEEAHHDEEEHEAADADHDEGDHDEEAHEEADANHEADEHEEDAHEHEHGEFDPHVWWYPLNVAAWADQIAAELARLDPEHAEGYEANAAAYRQELIALDSWITEQVDQIPASQRILVTDHDSLGYFVHYYNFELVGTVFPGLSTQAEPSAQELAQLTEAVQSFEVPAVFVGTTVSSKLAEQVAQETGVAVVPIYTDSLSEAGGPADTYLTFMRWNVDVMVTALSS